jgi:hypothetical protein
MSHRRKQILAGAAVVVVVVVAIVLVATLGGGTSTGTARDRDAISALALAYEKALHASTNVCGYLDPQSRSYVLARAEHGEPGGAETCSIAGELAAIIGVAILNVGMVPPGRINPAAVQFGSPTQKVDCSGDGYGPEHGLPVSQRGMRWASVAWVPVGDPRKGWWGAGGQGTFVREDGRWWVDVLICPGAGS